MDQKPLDSTSSASKPDNNLVWAILVTVLCCPLPGIFAIVKSTQVDKLWAEGDFEGAHKASKTAKKISIWTAIIMGGFWVVYTVLMFVVGIGGVMMDTGY